MRRGPFAGLRYIDDVTQAIKLGGAYELELHDAIEELVRLASSFIVNVGSGEGYYAIGLAKRLPQARVYAYDLDASERARCFAMARENGVTDRVACAKAATSQP